MKYSVGLVVISDRAYSGERADACLPAMRKIIPADRFDIGAEVIVDDDADRITSTLTSLVQQGISLVLTSGGTGCGVRDNTPEVSRKVIEKFTPGIDEAIRRFSQDKSRHAIYSRGVSGIAGQTLIINLPGSPRAVSEIMEFLMPTIAHALGLIAGKITDCGEEAGV